LRWLYGDGSVAFGKLVVKGEDPCPAGSWLATGWFADGFYRKRSGSRRIILRVVGRLDNPVTANTHGVNWFMPILTGENRDDVWVSFLEKITNAELRGRVNKVTQSQPFGGLDSGILVTPEGGSEVLLPVVGMALDSKKIGYQIAPEIKIPSLPTPPTAVVRGWREVEDTKNCRVIFRDHTPSFDAEFALA